GLTKTGPGTLTLSGTGTFSGRTTVAGGALALGGPGAAGSGAIALDTGTRLSFLGSGYTLEDAIRLADPASRRSRPGRAAAGERPARAAAAPADHRS
ncbi:hypothetical protein HPS26_24765, partial [Klebsiella aerogenes]|uniref:autotransporter-associated beta strand repeat-containing protein n=1 Tax=Klebsiella aerogenes TaxID=548 RepID=UPI0014953941